MRYSEDSRIQDPIVQEWFKSLRIRPEPWNSQLPDTFIIFINDFDGVQSTPEERFYEMKIFRGAQVATHDPR